VAGRVGVEAFAGSSIVLVAGGNTKKLPLDDWPAAIARNCREVILLKGTGTDELLPAIQLEALKLRVSDPVRGVFDNFTSALDRAVSLAHRGDVLLFSPGFTSFGMFLNEFDRGDHFTAYVQRLKRDKRGT
jgi:UDP-N-acetylmuramoylalanine--D-glutamate ligase